MRKLLVTAAVLGVLAIPSAASAGFWVPGAFIIAHVVNASFLVATTVEQSSGKLIAYNEVVPGEDAQTAEVNGCTLEPAICNEMTDG